MRQSWNDLRTLSIPYRVEQLQALKRMLEENTGRFEEALWKDLRKVMYTIIIRTVASHSECTHTCTFPADESYMYM